MVNRTREKGKYQCPSNNNLWAHPHLSSWKLSNFLVFKEVTVYAYGLPADEQLSLQFEISLCLLSVPQSSSTSHQQGVAYWAQHGLIMLLNWADRVWGSLGVTHSPVMAAVVPKPLLWFLHVHLNKLKSHRGHSVSVGFTVWGKAEQVHPYQSFFPSLSFGILFFKCLFQGTW